MRRPGVAFLFGVVGMVAVAFAAATGDLAVAAPVGIGRGFSTLSGFLAFSCAAPGPPWRMLAGVFFDVDMA